MNSSITLCTQILKEVNSFTLEEANPKERYSIVVKNRLRRSIFELQKKEIEGNEFSKCLTCFLIKKSYCICSKLSELSSKVINLTFCPKIRFLILMNDREFFKSSNTGKLINLIVPESEILIHGVPEHYEKFKELISQNLKDINETIVLFPGKESFKVFEYLETTYEKYLYLFSKKKESIDSEENEHFDRRTFFKNLCLNIVLIDGTWSQAKSINKFLPSNIPRVIISSKQISDFGPLRKQNKIGHISTIEAASLFLIDMKEILDSTNCSDLNTENLKIIADLLRESLNILIIHVIAQCKREYLKDILDKRNEKKFSRHFN